MKVWLMAAACLAAIGIPLLNACTAENHAPDNHASGKSEFPTQAKELGEVEAFLSNCIEESEGITFNLMSCNGMAIDKFDALMSEIVKHRSLHLSPIETKRLLYAQHAWRKGAPATCENDPDFKSGGTLAAVTYNACIADAFDARTRVLIGLKR